MAHVEISEEFNHEFQADRSHAQILMKITPSSKTFEEAKKVIEGSGARIIDTKHLSLYWLLVKLDVKDMRNVALKLSENGFLNIKGINAINFK